MHPKEKQMKKLFRVNILIIILLVLISLGCSVTPIPSVVKDPEDVPVIEENSSLFVEDGVTGITMFTTNDTKYSEQFGCTVLSSAAMMTQCWLYL
jgi:hypothetical protein